MWRIEIEIVFVLCAAVGPFGRRLSPIRSQAKRNKSRQTGKLAANWQTYHHNNTHARSQRHDRSQRSHSSYSRTHVAHTGHGQPGQLRWCGVEYPSRTALLCLRCTIFDTWIHNQFRIRDRLPYLGSAAEKETKKRKRWQQNELCICSLHR